MRARGVKPADQLVGKLVRREIDHADEHPLRDHLLHALSADAVGMEDHRRKACGLESFGDPRHRRRGVSQHRHRDEATLGRRRRSRRARPHHPGDRSGSVVEDGAAHGVQPEDVHHGVHEQDVPQPDEGAEGPSTGRHRSHDDLRQAQGQRLHGAGGHHCAFGAPEGDDSGTPAAPVQVGQHSREPPSHDLDGSAPRPDRSDRRECRTRRLGHALVADIGRDSPRFAEHAGVHDQDVEPAFADPPREVSGLAPLGVQRAHDGHRLPRTLRDDVQHDSGA